MSDQRKIYIFAPAASGKSTFNRLHQNYKGFQIVDFASMLPKPSVSVKLLFYLSRILPPLRSLARRSKSVLRSEKYFTQIFKFLREAKQDTIVFGRRPPNDLRPYADIEFALILIPDENHLRNCNSRRKEMRNPIPFMHHWTTDFKKVKAVRTKLGLYAQERGIPIFQDFKTAIDYMIVRTKCN